MLLIKNGPIIAEIKDIKNVHIDAVKNGKPTSYSVVFNHFPIVTLSLMTPEEIVHGLITGEWYSEKADNKFVYS